MTIIKYNDYPVEDCIKKAEKLIAGGCFVYQKFTCGKCGSRQTMSEPNKFYAQGQCEECSYITDIRSVGCNYLVYKGPAPNTGGLK